MDRKRNRFAKTSFFSQFALASLESILSFPVKIWRFEFNLFSLAASMILEILAFPLWAFYGFIFRGAWTFPPWWIHASALLLITAGSNKRGLVQKVRVLAGLDPLHLRMRYAQKDPKQKNGWFSRGLSMLLFSVTLATGVCWYWYVSFWSYIELGVDVGPGVNPITSFLKTWFGVVVPNYHQPWTIWVIGTFLVLIVSQKIPFIRWFLTRSRVLTLTTVTMLLLETVGIALWWNSLFATAFPI